MFVNVFQKGNLIPFPKGYLRFANYYDQDVFIWTAAIVILQLLISLVPLAKKTEGLHDGSVPYCYRFSGLFVFFFFISGHSINQTNCRYKTIKG